MKEFIKKKLDRIAANNILWFFLEPFVKISIFLSNSRIHGKENEHIKKLEKLLFKNLIIQNGPFKGVKYPEMNSICSTIYPKLLGCYEKELWNTIENLKNNKYTEIIDVGCAEGYYAVGLGMIIPNANVYAYDTDEKARALCEKMAILNNIKDKIIIKEKCTPEELSVFPFTGRGLIVCDCEGFEKELFNKENVINLTNCDLIIEAHDIFDITISTYLKEIFNKTHNIHSVKSIDDIEKAFTYNIIGLEKLNLSEKKEILSEQRGCIMEWLICTPKQ